MPPQEPPQPMTNPADAAWPPSPSTPAPTPTPKLPLTNTQLFWGIVRRTTVMGLGRGAALGAACGVIYFVVGVIYGLPIGAAIGLVLGFLDGPILGAVALRWFHSVGNPRRFRLTLCLVSGLVTLLVGTVVLLILDRLLLGGPNGASIILAVPVGLATLLAAGAGHYVAGWYATEAAKNGSA